MLVSYQKPGSAPLSPGAPTSSLVCATRLCAASWQICSGAVIRDPYSWPGCCTRAMLVAMFVGWREIIAAASQYSSHPSSHPHASVEHCVSCGGQAVLLLPGWLLIACRFAWSRLPNRCPLPPPPSPPLTHKHTHTHTAYMDWQFI